MKSWITETLFLNQNYEGARVVSEQDSILAETNSWICFDKYEINESSINDSSIINLKNIKKVKK